MRYDLNQVVTSDGLFLKLAKDSLLNAGWKLVACGDGVSAFSAYNAAGVTDVLTGALATNAWGVVRQPTITSGNLGYPGGREFLFWRSGLRFARSGSAYSGGTPSATVRPTVTGSDVALASMTGPTTMATHRLHAIMQTVAPFGFHMLTYAQGGATPGDVWHWMFDPVDPEIEQDPEPYIHSYHYVVGVGGGPVVNGSNAYNCAGISSEAASPSSGGAPAKAVAWYGSGLAGEQLAVCKAAADLVSNTRKVPNGTVVDPFNGKDFDFPVWWSGEENLSGLRHPKGQSQMLRWAGTARALGSTAGSLSRIYVDQLSWQWDGATTPLV